MTLCGTPFFSPALRAQTQSKSGLPAESANPALLAHLQSGLRPTEAIEFHFSYIGELFGNLSGGSGQGAIYEGLVKTGVEVDLEKLIGWKGATFYTDMLYPHGNGLTQTYTHDLEMVSSIDAYDSVRLNELWLEQKLFHDTVSLRLGEEAADTEFFVCDSGALFINGAFGAIPLVSANVSAPVYPLSAPAVRVEWDPTAAITWRTGIYNGDVGDQATNNQHGTRFSFSSQTGALILSELVYQTYVAEGATGLPGTFKLGGFYHTGEFDDISDNGVTHRDDYGIYAIIDQAIYRPRLLPVTNSNAKEGASNTADSSDDRGLNFFLRLGAALPEDRNLVTSYFEGGFNYKGLIPGREKDVCGLGCNCARINHHVRDESGAPVPSHQETVIEMTYQLAVTDWLSLQPDLQYITNPGGTDHTANAFVAGCRVTVDL